MTLQIHSFWRNFISEKNLYFWRCSHWWYLFSFVWPFADHLARIVSLSLSFCEGHLHNIVQSYQPAGSSTTFWPPPSRWRVESATFYMKNYSFHFYFSIVDVKFYEKKYLMTRKCNILYCKWKRKTTHVKFMFFFFFRKNFFPWQVYRVAVIYCSQKDQDVLRFWSTFDEFMCDIGSRW